MMVSLKSFAPVLANQFGTTPDAIYERQRALIRAKLLPAPTGRGRGNGLPATAETVSMLLIAILATDNLSDTDRRVKKLANAKIDPEAKVRRLQGSPNFRSALAAILDNDQLTDDVKTIGVSRTNFSAWITFRDDYRPREVCEFGRVPPKPSNLEIQAILTGEALMNVQHALHWLPAEDEAADVAKSLRRTTR
jgi:hypothetical protein